MIIRSCALSLLMAIYWVLDPPLLLLVVSPTFFPHDILWFSHRHWQKDS